MKGIKVTYSKGGGDVKKISPLRTGGGVLSVRKGVNESVQLGEKKGTRTRYLLGVLLSRK